MTFFHAPDGARLAFHVTGQGAPLLCLPGLTRTMADFDYVLPHLTGLVIRMDYRGRGASDWTGAGSYTVAQEALDALALLDHLGLDRVAILGTSRGGLVAMDLALRAKDRLRGVCFNDIGPVLQPAGLDRIVAFVGRNPAARTLPAFAKALQAANPAFEGVPAARWEAEAAKHARLAEDGLRITYDPALREAFLLWLSTPNPSPWAGFDALAGLPIALIRGANTDLLSLDTVDQMRRRRPDMGFANVPGRGHVPYLDEPESLALLAAFQRALP